MTYCTKCGAHNPDDASYCFNCGERLDKRMPPADQFAKRVEHGAEEFAERTRRATTQCFGPPPARRREALDGLGIASFAFFLILISGIYIINPNIINEIVAFIRDFRLVEVASGITLVAPASNHPVLYGAGLQFCIAFGLFQTLILTLRFFRGSSLKKKAETASGMVFWFGAAILTGILSAESISWFTFVAGLIILVGLSIVISALAPSMKADDSTLDGKSRTV